MWNVTSSSAVKCHYPFCGQMGNPSNVLRLIVCGQKVHVSTYVENLLACKFFKWQVSKYGGLLFKNLFIFSSSFNDFFTSSSAKLNYQFAQNEMVFKLIPWYNNCTHGSRTVQPWSPFFYSTSKNSSKSWCDFS